MKKKKIFIAGHKGMVGSALVRVLEQDKNVSLVLKNRKQLNLLDQNAVGRFFKNNKIDEVYIAAAKVGGIYANLKFPANFIFENLSIQSNIIHNSFLYGIKKLMFLGSSCIYPRNSKQPIKENQLLSNKLESTNEAYAIAKILGIKMCESYNNQYYKSHKVDYRCVMPTNLYGPKDNYNEKFGHVIPSLIMRFHKAKLKNLKSVKIWGTGKPKREFLHVNDLAKITVQLMNLKKSTLDKHITNKCSHINIGSGKDLSIKQLSMLIKEVIGFKGKIIFDNSKPDGVKRKLLEISILKKLKLTPKEELRDGLVKTYNSFLNEQY